MNLQDPNTRTTFTLWADVALQLNDEIERLKRAIKVKDEALSIIAKRETYHQNWITISFMTVEAIRNALSYQGYDAPKTNNDSRIL